MLILSSLHIAPANYQLGRNSVFLRTPAHTSLCGAMSSVGVGRLCVVQALIRGMLVRRREAKKRALLVKLQARVSVCSLCSCYCLVVYWL